MHLKVKDLRWANAQIAADEISPQINRDIRRAVQRWLRYRSDVAARKLLMKATAEELATTT